MLQSPLLRSLRLLTNNKGVSLVVRCFRFHEMKHYLIIPFQFVAHSNIQQLLAAMWYDGLPGFRRKPLLEKLVDLSKIILIFPYYCLLYMISGTSDSGKIIRKPFVKFVVHASSYLSFLCKFISFVRNCTFSVFLVSASTVYISLVSL